MYFWGWIFLITTTLLAFFKREIEPHDPDHEIIQERDIQTAYKSLLEILSLGPIQTLVIILLTCKVHHYLSVRYKIKIK